MAAITAEQIKASLSRSPVTTQTGVPMNAPPKQQKKIALANIYRYENNPRKTTNELLQSIKDSIRAVGLQQMFDVTQRPEDREKGLYVQSSGGGTRLEALKSLLADDQAAGVENSQYEYVFCMFHPYTDELTIEAAHLVENMQRTQMSYWDSAVGMMRFKASIEAKLGQIYSIRDLAEETAKLGMGIGRVTLGLYEFGVTNFKELGSIASQLSATKMEEVLRPTYLAAQRLGTRGDAAGAASALSDEAFKAEVIDPVLRSYASELGDSGVLDVKELTKRMEQATADAMGFDAKSFTSLNALAVSNAKASLAELLGKDTQTHNLFDGSDDDGDGGDELGGADVQVNAASETKVASDAAPSTFFNPEHRDRADASGAFRPVTDAEMAELERLSGAQNGQATAIAPPIAANTPNKDPLATMTTSIIAAIIASNTAMQASQSMAMTLGTAPAMGGGLDHPAPPAALISFTGSESPAQILNMVRSAARARVEHIANTYGVADCIVDAPLMPLGYVMDIPATPFDSSNATSAEAWWLLTYLSSLVLQDAQDVIQFIGRLPKDEQSEPLALAEFLQYYVSGELDDAQAIIGISLRSTEIGTFFWALCFAVSPCSDVLMELMQLIRILNQFQPNLMRHPLLPMSTPAHAIPGMLLNGYDVSVASQSGDHGLGGYGE